MFWILKIRKFVFVSYFVFRASYFKLCFEFPVPRTGRTSTKGTSSYFAEFLKEGSPARLSALTPTHLCRFAVRS